MSWKNRYKWPGQAAVVVSIVHVTKRLDLDETFDLDGKPTERITAYLFHAGSNDDPAPLSANAQKSFQGSNIVGVGFTFDDSVKGGEANSISLMNELIAKSKRNSDRIFPYIGGEEVNEHATHSHHRYVINFGQLGLEDAEKWPDLMSIVRDKVKPERDRLRVDTGPGAHGKKWWWQFQHPRLPLYTAIDGLARVLVISQVTSHIQFTFLPSRMVFSHTLNVFPFEAHAAFGVLQSRTHEAWVRFFASSLEDRLRYTPSDCFETFPFPCGFESHAILESEGKSYFAFRAELMCRNNEGLTKTYNRFHDPSDSSDGIRRLRDLHAAMDRTVLELYGWHDLSRNAVCEFLLDYEDDEDDGEESSNRRRKKPWRYRWPDEFRDEVLARLLALNAERAEEERLAGAAAGVSKPKIAKMGQKKKASQSARPKQEGRKKKPVGPSLFPVPLEIEHRYVLMLLRAWNGRAFTRRALNAAMILMRDDGLRKNLLQPAKRSTARSVEQFELNRVLTELAIDAFIEIDNSGTQQLIRILDAAPSTDGENPDDIRRVDEVREYFRRQAEAGNSWR